jgi:hypothetical protein
MSIERIFWRVRADEKHGGASAKKSTDLSWGNDVSLKPFGAYIVSHAGGPAGLLALLIFGAQERPEIPEGTSNCPRAMAEPVAHEVVRPSIELSKSICRGNLPKITLSIHNITYLVKASFWARAA